MEDANIFTRISALVDEEHAIQRSESGLRSATDISRLHQIEVALDRCWDLLRQRRALRVAGEDADGAEVRPEVTVEGYQQ